MVAARLGFEKAMVGTSLDPRPFWPRKKGSGELPCPEVSSRWNAAVSVDKGKRMCEV